MTAHFSVVIISNVGNVKIALEEQLDLADMAELADAIDLGSIINRCAGSSPVIRTKKRHVTSQTDETCLFCVSGVVYTEVCAI